MFWRNKLEALEFFNNLTNQEKDELGNQFVFGYYDWMDWFIDPPSKEFNKELSEVWWNWNCDCDN